MKITFNQGLERLSRAPIPNIKGCCSVIYSNVFHFQKQGRDIKRLICNYDTTIDSDMQRHEAYKIILKLWEKYNEMP